MRHSTWNKRQQLRSNERQVNEAVKEDDARNHGEWFKCSTTDVLSPPRWEHTNRTVYSRRRHAVLFGRWSTPYVNSQSMTRQQSFSPALFSVAFDNVSFGLRVVCELYGLFRGGRNTAVRLIGTYFNFAYLLWRLFQMAVFPPRFI